LALVRDFSPGQRREADNWANSLQLEDKGDIILTPIPQADGKIKNRPAIYLREMPSFRDALVCIFHTGKYSATSD